MGVAELLLRLGCALVAWLVMLAHCVWLAALGAVDCGSAGSQPWLMLLAFTPVTLGFALLLQVGFAVPGIGSVLRLPAVALAPLLVLAARGAYVTFAAVNLRGEPLCESVALWTRWWAPLMFAALLVVAIALVGAWRRGGN